MCCGLLLALGLVPEISNESFECITCEILNIMVFSFLQRWCHPLTKCIKKFLTSPVIMYFFFVWEGQNTNIKKGYACVYHLLRSVARSLLFRLYISSTCFYNQKKKHFFNTVLTLNANFLYYWPCSFNNVMFP